MDSSVSPKVALVTGGAIRLGKEIALGLAMRGYAIALHYGSSEKQAKETSEEIRAAGVECEIFQEDLRTTESTLIARVKKRFPDLSVLVNSASAYDGGTIADSSMSMFDLQMQVNLRAPFFLSRDFAALCDSGNIINIIDNKIWFNQYEYAAYLLSKKALAEFTRMAALEFAPAIRVNGVAPGVILPASVRSEDYMKWRAEGIPLKRKGETDNIVQAIGSILENDFISGQILTVDGAEGLTNTGRNAEAYGKAK